jgi:hypothetical protein
MYDIMRSTIFEDQAEGEWIEQRKLGPPLSWDSREKEAY